MASKGDAGGKPPGPPAGGKAAKKQPEEQQPPPPPTPSISQQAYDPIIKDDTPFPVPELYFKVYDSEEGEPEAKIRRDVGKLYERWEEKYGRRWPENGMNTDDLVWLAEEAYKPKVSRDERGKQPVQAPSLGAARAKFAPIEEERYPGEFLEEPVDDTPAAAGDGKGGKGGKRGGAAKKGQAASAAGAAAGAAGAGGKEQQQQRKQQRTLSNYEATVAGGNWVTDEFESADYEAGNLETLWGMHLWDYESKPLMMPDRPPDEAQGEESEDWDDFYGSYRPRFIDTDDAREAVWATDEFESDEDATESEWEPEYVGAGLGLEAEDRFNPQYSLRHSNHPLAPFPGEALKWSSFVYDDGTTYEGLTRDAVPHGMGVMTFGNGTGGGFHFRDVRRGDKYEGEFQVGYAHGLGQLTSENRGEVYIGEFFAGQRHGCGIRINMQPYYYLLERGEDPVAAYQKTHENIMRNIEFRTWYRNKALGSDHEDEVVLHAVRDDLDDPAAVVLRNSLHEAKLREWAAMDAGDKALRKAVEIIEGVEKDRQRRRGGRPTATQFVVGEDGRLHEALDTEGNDTDFDSVELMVGIDSEGGPGLGWVEDTEASELYPYDMKLQESMMADVAEDKLEESEDKEAVLGEDLVNPFTGLTLRDYLDGREGVYKDLMQRTGALDKLLGRAPAPPPGKQRKRLSKVADGEESSYIEDAHSLDAFLNKQLDAAMSRADQARAAAALAGSTGWATSSLVGGGPRTRNPYSEDTDTRFETESDQMELCELAEILGTVDEAKEVVAKARMWRWKPDGEVTYRFAQDAQGTPLPLMQDPLHYPHGTKFMAPGPLGQCHPVPVDKAIRDEMLRAAKNYAHVYSLYNFDYDPEPGSAQWKIDQRIKRAAELQLQVLGRMAEGAEAELAAEEGVAASSSAAPTAPTGKKGKKGKGGGGAAGPSGGGSSGAGPAAGGSGPQPQMDLAAIPEEEEEVSTSGGAVAAVTGGVWGVSGGAAPFASATMGMGRASRVLLNALTRAARHAPARRPHVLRPSHMTAAAAQRQRRAQAGPSAALFSLARRSWAPAVAVPGQQQQQH